MYILKGGDPLLGEIGTIEKNQQRKVFFDTSNGREKHDGWQCIFCRGKLCLAYNWIIYYYMESSGILRKDPECRIKLQLKIPENVRRRMADVWISLKIAKLKQTSYPILLQRDDNNFLKIETATANKIKHTQVIVLHFGGEKEQKELEYMDSIIPPEDAKLELDHLVIFAQLEQLIIKMKVGDVEYEDVKWYKVLKGLFGLDNPVVIFQDKDTQSKVEGVAVSATPETSSLTSKAGETLKVQEPLAKSEEVKKEEVVKGPISATTNTQLDVSSAMQEVKQVLTEDTEAKQQILQTQEPVLLNTIKKDGGEVKETQQQSVRMVAGTDGESKIVYRRTTVEEFEIPKNMLEQDSETAQVMQVALVEVGARFKECLKNFIQAPPEVTARIIDNAGRDDSEKEAAAPATTPGEISRLEMALTAFQTITSH